MYRVRRRRRCTGYTMAKKTRNGQVWKSMISNRSWCGRPLFFFDRLERGEEQVLLVRAADPEGRAGGDPQVSQQLPKSGVLGGGVELARPLPEGLGGHPVTAQDVVLAAADLPHGHAEVFHLLGLVGRLAV